MNTKYVKPWLFALLIGSSFGLGWTYGKDVGIKEGFKGYHQICYSEEHMIVDNDTKTVVQCKPLGVLPEVQQDPLDNGKKM